MSDSIQLICPHCKVVLSRNTVCENCGKTYVWLEEGRLISFQVDDDQFYQKCYEDKWKKRRDLFLPLKDVLLSLRERLSLSTRRERFFRRHLGGKDNTLILDVACGYGYKLLKEHGSVIGLDIVLDPLYTTSELYDLCVHADAFSVPFPDEYFDCIVSSDFLGHIPLGQKDDLYKEFRRSASIIYINTSAIITARAKSLCDSRVSFTSPANSNMVVGCLAVNLLNTSSSK